LAVVDDELRAAPVGVCLDDGGERLPAEMVGRSRFRPDWQSMLVGMGVSLADGREIVGLAIAHRAEFFVGNHFGSRNRLPCGNNQNHSEQGQTERPFGGKLGTGGERHT